VGTENQANGTLMGPYAGMALYFYKRDTRTGDSNSQEVGSASYIVAP
jgi:hypothetical protein